jgi:signal transduction histidine kinase
MRSLFLKIFLWFWLATILVAAVFIGLDLRDRARGTRAGPLDFLVNSIGLHGQSAVDRWERGGRAALATYCVELEQKLRLDSVLFDSGRVELSGRPAPAGAAEMAARVLDSGKADAQRVADGPLIAAPVCDSAGRRYAFVVVPTGGPLGQLLADPSGLLRRLGAVVLTAAVVCYALARYLAAPIRRLRAATRRLAQGDLAVRVGPLAGHRRDELGELGCDFDFMAERLESLVATQRRLLRDISHELRSPLARLNVALELGREQQTTGTPVSLDRIEEEAERLDELIGQLLVLARLEGGGQEPARTAVALDQLVREVAADADFEAAGHNRRVRIDHCDKCTVDGSVALLRSALENVMRNAVRHTADGTDVEASLRQITDETSACAMLEIRDHGPGVPDAALERIFEPFYRVSDARDRETGGTGLGLAITEQAIRFHGGKVSATNAPDGGLIVRIELPYEPGLATRAGSANL